MLFPLLPCPLPPSHVLHFVLQERFGARMPLLRLDGCFAFSPHPPPLPPPHSSVTIRVSSRVTPPPHCHLTGKPMGLESTTARNFLRGPLLEGVGLRIGINGLGRIGRGLLRSLFEDNRFEVAAVNDVASTEVLAHLLNHDSYYHSWSHAAEPSGREVILLDGAPVPCFHHHTPGEIPWSDHGVDWVVEATGRFKDRENLEAHGVPVILSAASGETDRQVVFGVNHEKIKAGERILSATSCTTHCVASPLKVLAENFDVKSVLFNTVHCYNVNQTLVDAPQRDLRRARAGALNIIPTTTSASRAIESVLPELRGRILGMAIRVPAPATSLTEIIARVEPPPTSSWVSEKLRAAALGDLKGILAVTDEELVSQDFVGNTASSIVDESLTAVNGGLLRLIAWYDNEWGYIHRLVDLLAFLKEKTR